jgi:hypothetical protein
MRDAFVRALLIFDAGSEPDVGKRPTLPIDNGGGLEPRMRRTEFFDR